MSHDTLVLIAKVVGPLWMGGFLIVVLIRSYNPARRAEQERIARSILEPGPLVDGPAMTTDPDDGHREVDPITGYETTGHDWGGIRELNTPLPKVPLVALALAFAYAVVAWVLLPAWPTGRDHTRGLLGLDQGEVAMNRLQAIETNRAAWLTRFEAPDFTALAADPALMALAMPAARRLSGDNCAACHGEKGEGGLGIGAPSLTDRATIQGQDAQTVYQTLTHGRRGLMPAWAGRLSDAEINLLALYVAHLSEATAEPTQ